MIELKLQNKKRTIHAKSKDVKAFIELRPDIEGIQDISNTINQEDIMVFDCQLCKEVFDLSELEAELKEAGEEMDESEYDVIFDDVRAYVKDSTDEIEVELQDKYGIDDIRCCFDIYRVDETFTDFKFVFLVSFKEIKIASLLNLAQIVGRRQLVGASKFYS